MRAATTIRTGPAHRATRRPPGRFDSHKKWTDRRGPVTYVNGNPLNDYDPTGHNACVTGISASQCKRIEQPQEKANEAGYTQGNSGSTSGGAPASPLSTLDHLVGIYEAAGKSADAVRASLSLAGKLLRTSQSPEVRSEAAHILATLGKSDLADLSRSKLLQDADRNSLILNTLLSVAEGAQQHDSVVEILPDTAIRVGTASFFTVAGNAAVKSAGGCTVADAPDDDTTDPVCIFVVSLVSGLIGSDVGDDVTTHFNQIAFNKNGLPDFSKSGIAVVNPFIAADNCASQGSSSAAPEPEVCAGPSPEPVTQYVLSKHN